MTDPKIENTLPHLNIAQSEDIKMKNQQDNFTEKDNVVVQKKLKGFLEGCDEHGIRGWVINEDNPDEAVEVGIFIDGNLIVQVTANLFRVDLLDAGIGNGQCGFNIPMPTNFFDGLNHQIELKEAVTGIQFAQDCVKAFTLSDSNSETLVNHNSNAMSDIQISSQKTIDTPKTMLVGNLEGCDIYGIRGWVINEEKPNVPVTIGVFIDNELITQTLANAFRQDLLDAGIGNGYCAFNVSIPAKFFDGEEHKVETREIITDQLLPSSIESRFKCDTPFINDTLIQSIDQTNISGSVEYIYPTLIYGWAYNHNQDQKSLIFSVLVNNQEYFQKVDWLQRYDITEKYGNTALYSHFKIIPSESLKTAMSEAMSKNEDIIVLVNGQELPKADEIILRSSGLKLAVVVHVYDEKQLEIIDNYLKNIDFFFDLFITVPENVAEKLQPNIDALFFRREFRIVKNIGNDVAPFVDLVNELDQRGYDLVCKLHTKPEHEEYKELWRDCMLEGVLGNRLLVAQIIQSFKDDSQLSIVGPALTYLSARMNTYDNGDNLRAITSLLFQPNQVMDDWGFFAGSMFWARVDMFQSLQNVAVKKMLTFSPPSKNTAYLLEMLFGVLPWIQKRKIGLVDYKTVDGEYSQYLKILNAPIAPRQSFSKNIEIFSLIKKEIWPKWNALNHYKFLDKKWYLLNNSKIIRADVDCLADFLIEKNEQGYLNEDHEKSQINIRFEKNKIYLDDKDGLEIESFNWPETYANSLLLSEHKIFKTANIEGDVKVSVICSTYNHENYIKEALEGFIKQKTNFRFEVIIGDDASTDNTQAIIKEYAEKYPDIFVPVLRETNIGARNNFLDLCSRIKGKFVALNEGDDYWTDPNKLQIQVDYLDSHPKCTLCFHLVKVLNELNPKKNSIFPTDLTGEVLLLDDIVKRNFIQTNSVMYRWGFHGGFGDDYNVNAIPGDLYLHSLHANLGEIHFIPKVMAVYRRHSGGMFAAFTNQPLNLVKKWGVGHIELFRTLDRKFNNEYTENYLSKELSILRTLIPEFWQEGNFEALANIVVNYKDTAQIVFNELKIGINLLKIKDEADFEKELKSRYKISVLITSYNHAPHLSECLDNVLAQKGFFSLEVIVADDDSSDGTREIAEDYAARYPKTIRVLSKTSNMGMLKNMKRGFNACNGNFIAICEGDDYWISEMKLHKQLWMLIRQPELSMCFNWLLLRHEGSNAFTPHQGQAVISKNILTFDDLIAEPLTANFSCCMYRAKTVRSIPHRYYNEKKAADWLFNLCAATTGNIGFLKETLSVYRVHEKGQWSGLSPFEMDERKKQAKLKFRSYFSDRIPDNELNKKQSALDNPTSIKCNIDRIEIKYNSLFINGWLIDQKIKSSETEDKSLLIRDLHNRIVHTQFMENLTRHDLDRTLSPQEKGRYSWAGFSTVFCEPAMKPGVYQLLLGLPSGAIPVRKLVVFPDCSLEVTTL